MVSEWCQPKKSPHQTARALKEEEKNRIECYSDSNGSASGSPSLVLSHVMTRSITGA